MRALNDLVVHSYFFGNGRQSMASQGLSEDRGVRKNNTGFYSAFLNTKLQGRQNIGFGKLIRRYYVGI